MPFLQSTGFMSSLAEILGRETREGELYESAA